MDLIDRYVYAVAERLPTNSRDDVTKELRSIIEDMLPENATENEIRSVLVKFGNPIKLAAEYNQDKKYLIGPGLYEEYLSVLKLVMGITSVVVVGILLLSALFKPSADIGLFNLSVSIFTQMFGAIFQMLTQVFLWVTIVFIILEKTGVPQGRLPFVKNNWSPDDLPTMPIPEKKRISRNEVKFSIFFTIIFTVFICFKPQLIGWYEKGSDGLILAESFLNIERLQTYVYIIVIFSVVQLFICIYKFIVMYWNLPLAIITAVYNLMLCALAVVMISDYALLNQGFLSRFSSAARLTIPEAFHIWQIGGRVFVVFFVGISIWESIENFIKSNRK